MSFKLTKKRTLILDVLKNHHGTLSAADLHVRLPQVDLVTVYRNLEAFTNEKLIKRVLLDTGEARYEYQQEPHHHAICTHCDKVIHFKAPDTKIIKLLGLKGFNVDEFEVMVKGRCHK